MMLSKANFKRARPGLGTFLEIETDSPLCESVLTKVFQQAEALENIFSKFLKHSELSQFNDLDLQDRGEISLDFKTVLHWAQKLYLDSAGAFYPYDHTGRLDLSGIAKGYVTDQMAHQLEDQNLKGHINAGGDIRFFGEPPFHTHVRVGGPRGSKPLSFLPLELKRKALAVSSFDESLNSTISNTKYRLTPYLPLGATVVTIADQGLLADAFTKIFWFAPLERANVCARKYQVEGLVIDGDGQIVKSFGLQ